MPSTSPFTPRSVDSPTLPSVPPSSDLGFESPQGLRPSPHRGVRSYALTVNPPNLALRPLRDTTEWKGRPATRTSHRVSKGHASTSGVPTGPYPAPPVDPLGVDCDLPRTPGPTRPTASFTPEVGVLETRPLVRLVYGGVTGLGRDVGEGGGRFTSPVSEWADFDPLSPETPPQEFLTSSTSLLYDYFLRTQKEDFLVDPSSLLLLIHPHRSSPTVVEREGRTVGVETGLPCRREGS